MIDVSSACLERRRSAGRTDERERRREQNVFPRAYWQPNQITGSQAGRITIDRTGDVVVNPLADIVGRMFVAVGVRGGQRVVDVLRNGKRRKGQQEDDQADR